jgi:predicted transcriptional regulator
MATQKKILTKRQLIQSFEQLPDDAAVEDFIDHFAFVLGVEQGMADIAAGRTITDAELLEEIKSWRG